MSVPVEPVTSRQQLIDYFVASATHNKGRKRKMLGLELELLGVRPPDCRAVGYSEPNGIRALLHRLAGEDSWEAVHEGGQLLELKRGDARLTLEPGAQTELSLTAFDELEQNRVELEEIIAELSAAARALGFRWLGLAVQPVSTPAEIELLPKRRYGLMDERFQEIGEPSRLARWMMRATGSVQVNLDYSDEAEGIDQLRVGLGIAPLVTALCAHSPIAGGRAREFASFRAEIWRHTDPARCGLPDLFGPDVGFADYVDYALGVPLLFVVENGGWEAGDGRSFADLMRDGKRDGSRPGMRDWEIHINSIFTEIRLKKYIEVRAMDAPPPGGAVAVAGLWAGLMYDAQARAEAWELVAALRYEERLQLLHDVARHGLGARMRGLPLWHAARALLRAARGGLERLGYGPVAGAPAGEVLAPLEELAVGAGRSAGERVRGRWRGDWRGSVEALVGNVAYD